MTYTLNFVWFGGPITATSVKTIREWADFLTKIHANSGDPIKICLWLDAEGSSKEAIDKTKKYLDVIKDVELDYRDISELKAVNGEMHRIMRYEIDKLNPNYAAASDVCRYTILENEGGMYLDMDVAPPEQIGGFVSAWEEHGVLITEAIEQFTLASPNDLLVSPDAHLPLLQKVIQKIEKNYQATYQEPDHEIFFETMVEYSYSPFSHLMLQTYSARDQETIYTHALKRTGPDMLKTCTHRDSDELVPENKVMSPGSLRVPLEIVGSAASWVGRPTNMSNDFADVVDKISKCVDFELSHQRILRTDDHIQSAIEALGYAEPDDSVSIKRLTQAVIQSIQDKLTPEKLSSLKCCQLTFKFPETLALYTNNHLLIKTGLTPFTPKMYLQSMNVDIHQPFATQYRILPHDQNARNQNFDLGAVQRDLERANLAFHTNLLLFYQTQYHNGSIELLKFTAEELKYYIEILNSTDVKNSKDESILPQNIQNLKAQLLSNANAAQVVVALRDGNISGRESMKLRMLEFKLSKNSDQDLTERLKEKIEKLENVPQKTEQQQNKLQTLQAIQKVQDGDWDEVKALFQQEKFNKHYLIRNIGIETFVLANMILNRGINVVEQIAIPPETRHI